MKPRSPAFNLARPPASPGLHGEPPALVAWLGYGGLLPFVALAVLAVALPARAGTWATGLVGYGAAILSFVGALHWGFAMSAPGLHPRRRQWAYAWSVVPALLAWIALMLPPPAAPLLLVLGFGLHLVQDHRLAGPAQLPPWYLPLRWRLTAVASLCLLVPAALGLARG